MILKVAYTGNDIDFLEDVKKVVEQYPLIKLETFCKDRHLTQKDYYKLINYYATKADKFMVLLDKIAPPYTPSFFTNFEFSSFNTDVL